MRIADLIPTVEKTEFDKAGPIFDAWRQGYDEASLAQHQLFAEACHKAWPEHSKCFSEMHLREFLRHLPAIPIPAVLEVGGWDGEAAKVGLEARTGIRVWVNWELARVESVVGEIGDDRYLLGDRDSWVWDGDLIEDANTLVLSHSIEHMRFHQFGALMRRLPSLRWVYVDAPLPENTWGNTWPGYIGTHIFELGWAQLGEAMASWGFDAKHIDVTPGGSTVAFFERARP